MKNKLNIATILPYKENYTFSKAQAAAIWVKDFFRYSKHKNNNYIFGNTNSKDYLTKNYVNIKINSLKSKFTSSTIEYCNNFIKISKNNNYDIIEIHNRPLVYTHLKNKIDSKFILYFHNDPLSMSGSKTVKERIDLINNIELRLSDWDIFVWKNMIYESSVQNKLMTYKDIITVFGTDYIERNNSYSYRSAI